MLPRRITAAYPAPQETAGRGAESIRTPARRQWLVGLGAQAFLQAIELRTQ